MTKQEPFNVMLVCRSGGDYTLSDVFLIAKKLKEIHKEEVRVICLNDNYNRTAYHPKCLFLPLRGNEPGWWAKMNLFRPSLERFRPFLYMDLDTMVLGDLRPMLKKINRNRFTMLTDLYEEIHGPRAASGVMWFPAGSGAVSRIWQRWDKDRVEAMKKLRGDQDFIASVEEPEARFQDDVPGLIVSIKPLDKNKKPELREERPGGAVLCCLHGKPRLEQAAQKLLWVAKYCGREFTYEKREEPDDKSKVKPSTNMLLKLAGRQDAPVNLGPWFSILCPTRGRPELARRMVESVYRTAALPQQVETFIYVDSNDEYLDGYLSQLDHLPCHVIVGPSDRGFAPEDIGVDKMGIAWNQMARMASGRYLMMGNDDLVWETKDWDLTMLHRLWKIPDQIFLAWADDGINGREHCAFPIVSQRWVYGNNGEFVPECFQFLYHDTWLFDVAKRMDLHFKNHCKKWWYGAGYERLIYFDNIKIKHDHCGDSRPVDDIHKLNRRGRMAKHDKEVFESKYADELRTQQRANLESWSVIPCQNYGDEELGKLFHGKRVALVGPSPHLQRHGKGGEIDGYDCICRVNEVYPFGLEADYGSRTDVVFHTCNPVSVSQFQKGMGRYVKDGLPPFKAFVRTNPGMRFSEDDFVREVLRHFPDCPLAKLNAIHFDLYFHQVGSFPNTGILALLMIANYKPKELLLTGFSFYAQGMDPEARHHKAYIEWGGDNIYNEKDGAKYKGHPQEPQRDWFIQHFLPTYGNMIRLDSYLADSFNLKFKNVLDLKSLSKEAKKAIETWKGAYGMKHQYRGSDEEWPDKDGPDLVRYFVGEGKVCDVGCGIGRVAPLFEPDRYIGIDINEKAVVRARKEIPDHDFEVVEHGEYPPADTYLFHTVALHIPDDELPNVASRLRGRVVIFESMDRSLRNGGVNYQRNPEEYQQVFEEAGFTMLLHSRQPSSIKPGFRDYMVFQKEKEAAK